MNRFNFLWISLGLVMGSQGVVAAEHIITLKNRAMSKSIAVVKPGEAVTFINEDRVAHNIVSLKGENQFDLDAFKPGDSRKVTFAHGGVADIECTIHPGMKMTVFVWEKLSDI